MDEQLTDLDFELILESLKHYKMNVENYDRYPSYEFKQQQMERVETAMKKVKALRESARE